MKTSILIVSHLPDLPYLVLNLRSIAKFAKGFHEVVVLVPQNEYDSFRPLADTYPISLVYYFRNSAPSQWHLAHQLQKCWADSWCPDADFVLHTDSDCMFTEPVTPEDYFVTGKPVMLYTHYDKLTERTPWRPVVSAVLKKRVNHEFMRRHPQVNPIGVYPALREHLEQLHVMGFDEFVMTRRANPLSYSEHNILGAFAFDHPGFKNTYHWHDTEVSGTPHEKLLQFWSLSPVDKPQKTPHGQEVIPAEVAERILS